MSEQQSLSDTPQSPAEKRARKKFGDGFESLDDKIKDILIRQEQELMELEPLAEKERERQAYREQKKREAAFTRSQLAEFGVAERVAYDWNPRKMNAIEEDSIDISCGFSENELEPVSYANGHVVGFRRSTIEAMVPHMQDIWARANAHDDVQRSATGYMMFHLWTSSMHRDGTKVIHITDDWERDLNNLFEAESELIKSVEDGEARYSYVYNDVNISHMHLFFSASYYPEPKSVKNWGIGIKPIEKRSAFDIFTASDPNVPCAVQVARRLWGDDVEQYDLEGIIVRAGSALCIVKPHSSVHTLKEINDYSDLVVVSRSPIKSLSVIDQSVIYLLYFNDHVVTMCFDIECYFDPDKDQRHVPYLCCACVVYDDVPGNVMEFEGRDCVAQMIDYAAENVAKFGLDAIELIAHNGGGYDFHYILSSMYDPGAVKNILIRNNTFISFQFTHMDVKFSVKDSLNFLLCSLSKAAKAFLRTANREN
ncbi:hypothetical protein EV175_002980 [Coemansia sp. RSA 1933]|nr:hypothetical protein EV175_002980 [Coemansia sp. RSA 1933]